MIDWNSALEWIISIIGIIVALYGLYLIDKKGIGE
jgi:hypothetical protein